MIDEQPTLAGDDARDAGGAALGGNQAPATLSAVPEELASQLIGILDEYVERLKAGTAPSRAQLIAAHPELARQLEACLAGLEFIHGTARTAAAQAVALGDFRILREVGRGGMGAVYEAEQISLGRRVALKVLRFGAVSEPEAITRFQREAETVARLHHTNIVPIFSVGSEHGVNFYAMQFIEGRSLAQVLADRAGPLDPDQVAEWGLQAAEALEHAHRRGVIHRDVKPSNLLLDNDGRIWLTDFGLAKRLDDATLSMTGALLGTPRYMSPEQASSGERRIDHRTDLFSLGATLYELATGRPVFDGDSPHRVIGRILNDEVTAPRSVRPDLSRDLETILLKCLNKDPGQRYRTARELADDLRALTEGRPIAARRPGLVERGVKWLRRQQRSVALTAAAVAATLLVVATGVGGSVFYANWRSSYLALETSNPPLVAEVLDRGGRSLSGPVTVPLQQPLTIPAGEHELEVSAKERLSQRYQLPLPRGQRASFDLSLEDQLLWRTIEADCTYHLVDTGGRHDLLLLDDRIVRYVRGSDGKLEWTADVGTLHQDPRWNAAGFVWDWKQGDGWFHGFDELDQRPTPVAPATDLNGDGHADLVLAGRHQAWLLAMSGRDGSVLWLTARGEDVRAAQTQQSIASHGTVSGVWGGVEVLPDINGDDRPDLLVTVVDVRALPDAEASTTAPRRRVEAISGADGTVLWNYEIPDSLFELPPSEEPPYRMQWFYGRQAGERSGNSGGSGSGTFHRRWQQSVQQRNGDSVFMPQAARRVALPGGADCILLIAGRYLLRLDPANGQPLAPPADLGFLSGQPAVLGDVDGDRVPELILLDEPGRTPGAGQAGMFNKRPLVRVSVCSLLAPRVIWQRDVQAWWPVRPRWHIPPPAWPVVEDLDGDGRCDLLVPDGTSEWQSGNLDSAPWGELARLDGRTGEVRWRRRIRCLDQFVDRFTVGPDVDGDGTRDVFSAVFWGNQGDVYVDATSGADGQSLYWLRSQTAVPQDRIDNQLLGPLFWWSGDKDGMPLLAVPTTEIRPNEIAYTVACVSVQHGQRVHHATGLGLLEAADLDGDGVRELLSYHTKDRQEMIDYGGRLNAFRGYAGTAWRRLGPSPAPVGDLNGDGIRDLAHDRGDGIYQALSGKDATSLWTVDTRDLMSSARPLRIAVEASTADLDGDGVPDPIVYRDDLVTSTSTPYPLLHALSGRTGRRLWSAAMQLRFIRTVVSVTSADLDGDGVNEILWIGLGDDGLKTDGLPSWQRTRMWLVVLDGRQGRVRWKQALSAEHGQPDQPVSRLRGEEVKLPIGIGDLDGDGVLDVVVPVEVSMEPPELEYQAFSGRDGRRLWSVPVELPRRDSNALADLLPCTVTDLDADGVVEVLVLDYVSETRSDGVKQLLQRVRAIDGKTGHERWTRQFPVAHAVSHLHHSSDRSLRPRVTVLRRASSEPWLGLNLWTSPEELVVLDHQGNDVSRLQLETTRGVHQGRFSVHACDTDGDGSDELVLFHQDALIAARPETPGQPLWRWPVDTLEFASRDADHGTRRRRESHDRGPVAAWRQPSRRIERRHRHVALDLCRSDVPRRGLCRGDGRRGGVGRCGGRRSASPALPASGHVAESSRPPDSRQWCRAAGNQADRRGTRRELAFCAGNRPALLAAVSRHAAARRLGGNLAGVGLELLLQRAAPGCAAAVRNAAYETSSMEPANVVGPAGRGPGHADRDFHARLGSPFSHDGEPPVWRGRYAARALVGLSGDRLGDPVSVAARGQSHRRVSRLVACRFHDSLDHRPDQSNRID
jgi:predicted Ser/Thr protein kinase